MPRFGARRGRAGVVVGAAIWAGFLFGCAGQPLLEPGFSSTGGMKSAQGSAVHAGASHHIPVPFFPDNTDQCGPATLASILTYWGVPTDPLALKGEIYLPRLRGTLPLDLLLAAQARGLKAEAYQGSLENLKSELEAGHPLVAFLNLGYTFFPQGHYVVVTGYDDRRQGVYVHSSLDRDVFLPYERFVQGWGKTGRWTLLVLPQSGQGRPRR